MVSIEIDFDVYKELTMRRETENVTYNEVIRHLLGMGGEGPSKKEDVPSVFSGCVFQGITFPNGTQFRVTYKGRTYGAQIIKGCWIGEDGEERNSPSEAAHAITKTNVNGWRFWQCRLPTDHVWRSMDSLR